MATLVHELISDSAHATPDEEALVYGEQRLDYASIAKAVDAAADAFLYVGMDKGDRVAVYLEKRIETVTAMFAAAAAGGVFVPVNPLLKSAQVQHILVNCAVKILVTSAHRLLAIMDGLIQYPALQCIVVVGAGDALPFLEGTDVISWETVHRQAQNSHQCRHRVIDTDIAAIFYTSGSTGKPKGVVVSHRNLVAGAVSVASYLQNVPQDRILSVLPLSFDYGFNQLTTAFYRGSTVVLMNHLFARDIATAVRAEQITGLAAVPPLWAQLAELKWDADCTLRYLTNSGGTMPSAVTARLRSKLPNAQLFLMYGLTEAFRSTYLPPSELMRRPDSIGKAIPNAEVLVLREDGSECDPNEPGELVHRGGLVAMGYWDDAHETSIRFKPIPVRHNGLVIQELAVWSGDTVHRDSDGFIYFIGRRDDMIKTSGYRISPVEIEEILYGIGGVLEAAAIGVSHPLLGQAIIAVLYVEEGSEVSSGTVEFACKQHLPAYMIPTRSIFLKAALPKNPNGKIDRKLLAGEFTNIFAGIAA